MTHKALRTLVPTRPFSLLSPNTLACTWCQPCWVLLFNHWISYLFIDSKTPFPACFEKIERDPLNTSPQWAPYLSPASRGRWRVTRVGEQEGILLCQLCSARGVSLTAAGSSTAQPPQGPAPAASPALAADSPSRALRRTAVIKVTEITR